MQAPVTGYCSGCRTEQRLRFAGFAGDGRENGARPRAFYRQCGRCSTMLLVLGDVGDGMGLVRNVIRDWKHSAGVEQRATGNPALRSVDYDDLAGEMLQELWKLYLVWNPGQLSFLSYASGLLPLRVNTYLRDAVGGEELYRSNGVSSVRQWPKAHATSVCVSIEGTAASIPDADDREATGLVETLGARTADPVGDRSPDLARVLSSRGR